MARILKLSPEPVDVDCQCMLIHQLGSGIPHAVKKDAVGKKLSSVLDKFL